MSSKSFRAGFLALMVMVASAAFATDVSRTPLGVSGTVAPNVIFGMDDSGSMDMETLLPTNEGIFWWHESNQSGWDNSGSFYVNSSGLSNSSYTAYTHLFPVGCTSSSSGGGGQRICESIGVYAVPPIPQFAPLRSSAYNPLYYNPSVTYAPWPSATVSGTPMTFSNSTATAARAHPLYSSPTLDLTGTQDSTSSSWTFRALRGMTIPANFQIYSSSKWRSVSSNTTIGSGSYSSSAYDVAVPYYPATYWQKESCSVNGTSCVSAPDSGTLKRYEVKSGVTFPSGRSYAAEMQNFANWFTYYRKRHLMLSSSMGKVIDSLSGMRVGLTEFNSKTSSNVTMYETDSSDSRANGRVVAGMFYKNLALGGTPTRDTLKYIGDQYNSNKNIVTASCQRNTAFVVTDGFANATSVSVPSYNKNLYGSGAPYQTTHSGSIADIALSYYTNRLRTDLTAGLVPAASSESTNPAADRNKDLHVNTYGITLGARGAIWPGITDAYAQPISWVNATSSGMPESIDDLWHATVNGRGKMFLATTPDETADNIQTALTEILRLAGAQSGVTFSTVNLKASNSTAYTGSYNTQGWSGDVAAYAVNPATGELATSATWSAASLLLARDWTKRNIASYNGTSGVAFTNTAVGSSISTSGLVTSSQAIDYFRGDRSLEPTKLRVRTGLMGAIINAEPVVDTEGGVVFAVSGDGMVHAFSQSTGAELWGYVPSFVLPTMGEQLSKTWAFRTLLDATPTLAPVGAKKYLVGTRGTAGAGVYALDVTNASSLATDGQVAAAVKWEFPNASTSTSVKNLMGAVVSKPLVVDTTSGSVVVFASGYFPDSGSTGDGKARVFVLDATTGTLLRTIAAPVVSGDSGEAGLSALSGYLESNGKVQYVYGGDERGHVWRFDITNGDVLRLATLKDKNGSALPVTAAPELARINNRRMVFVGTGRFLGDSDFVDNQRHSFFALWDDNTTIASRAKLAERAMTVSTSGTREVTGTAVDWTTQRGWVVELPAGEKANKDPALASGVVVFTTNSPSKTLCSASSALYIADASSGLQLPDSVFTALGYFGTDLGASLTAQPVLTRLTNGRMGVTTRQSDGTDATRSLGVGAAASPKKTSWREVLR